MNGAAVGPFLIVLIALVVLALVVMIAAYNGLVSLRQHVKGAWSDVDVNLKRRSELIPNLVEAVKAYASHEQRVLMAVTEARAHAAVATASLGHRAEAEQHLGQSLFRVLAVAENYPELKASANFSDLQKELSETERVIASARQYYNACVRDFNTKIEAFPSNIVASIGSFKQAEFFEVDTPSERNVPAANL